MYESNPQNSDLDELRFDCDQTLVTGWKIYCVNGDIIETVKNGSIVDVYKNWM